MTEEITQPQAEALANLLHQIRPEWSTPSMMKLLAEHRRQHEYGPLCRAAINVALDPTKRTPAIIFLDGKHWLTTEQQNEPARTAALGNDTSDTCPNHPGTKTWACKPCHRADPRPANFRELVAAAQKAQTQ